MGRKCSTCWDGKSCKSGFATDPTPKKYKLFRFPKDEDERKLWVLNLPNKNLKVENITDNMAICERHWQPGFETKSVNGKDRPVHPPTEFGDTSSACRVMTASTSTRNIKSRKVTAEEREKATYARQEEEGIIADTIKSWEELASFCRNLDMAIKVTDHEILLFYINGFPPIVDFSISIDKTFKVQAFKGSSHFSILLKAGIQRNTIAKYSDVGNIIDSLKSSDADIHKELHHFGESLQNMLLNDNSDIDSDQMKRLKFLCNQLIAQGHKKHCEQNAPILQDAIDLFLRSRSAYKAMCKVLMLPSLRTISRFFENVAEAGGEQECVNVIKTVFWKLEGLEKFCFITADEIYVKPSVRFAGNKIIGMAVDDTTKPAKTCLAIMVNFLLGQPAFVARIVPVHSLKGDFLTEILLNVCRILNQEGAVITSVMTDNLSVNRKMFNLLHEQFGTHDICSINHPFENDYLKCLFVFSDPVHLFKNIRNGWITEKTQSLKFLDPISGKTVVARFKDIKAIFKLEQSNMVRMTKLSYAAINPNSFERQKVDLVVNVFDEKVIAALKKYKYDDTALFVERVTKMWHILNIKNVCNYMNDPDREPFRDPKDPRLDFLLKMATSFKLMDTSIRGKRIQGLSSETACGLHVMLHGMVNKIRVLLSNGFEYILPGKFQSDRLEREFGLYRADSGANFFISVEQVSSSLTKRRIKMFKDMGLDKDCLLDSRRDCCPDIQTCDEDMECLDNAFEHSSNLNEEERASIYFICGYIAFKEGLGVSCDENIQSSEFTNLVSRGNLSHPPAALYDYALYCYSFFKDRKVKCCTKVFIQGFEIIYNSTGYEWENISGINRRLTNCFFKAHAKCESEKIQMLKAEKNRKKRKLRDDA